MLFPFSFYLVKVVTYKKDSPKSETTLHSWFYFFLYRSTLSRFQKVAGLTLLSHLISRLMGKVVWCEYLGEMEKPAISDTLCGLMSAVVVKYQLRTDRSRSLKSLLGTNPRKTCKMPPKKPFLCVLLMDPVAEFQKKFYLFNEKSHLKKNLASCPCIFWWYF